MNDLQALRLWIAENLESAYERQSKSYNLRRKNKVFRVGELVLKRQHILSSAAQNIAAKLTPKFHEPFTVKRVLSPVVYELCDPGGGAEGTY